MSSSPETRDGRALEGVRELDSDRYERLERLGAGGMAVVYRAFDRKLRREVAIKQLRDGVALDAEGFARFRREAEAVSRSSHPNVVTFFDAVEDASGCYLVMELVAGEPLSELLKTRRLELRAAIAIMEKVARGIHHSHEQGVIHRDLKPSNILVGPNNEPKIADFGVAQLASGTTILTKTGELLGTPVYMAPEQAEGRTREIDARTDVYALGVVLYEILTGRPPHDGTTIAELVARIVNEDPVAPRKLARGIPRDLETIALKAMEKSPARRYASALALADDLARFLRGEPIVARRPGALARAARWTARNARLVLALAAIAAVAASSAVALVVQTERAARLERERLAGERRRAVEAAIASIGSGMREDLYRSALFQLGGSRDDATVAVLVSALDGATRELEEARRDVYRAGAVPTPEETRAGLEKIEGVDAALAAATTASAAVIARIESRLVARALRDVPPDVRKGTPRPIELVGLAQARRLGTGGIARARLACEALGLVGIRERAVLALGRHLTAECDEERAAVAGIALARLGGDEASRYLQAQHRKFPNIGGDFWRAVGRHLKGETRPGDESASARIDCGLTKEAAGDLDGAIAEYARVIESDPRNVDAWIRRGFARNKKNDLDAALADFARALELDPRCADAYAGRAYVQGNKGNLKAGIADCTSAIALDPTQAAHWNLRGGFRWRAKSREGAIADLTKAIELEPRRAPYWSNRGTMRVMLGDLENGIADLTRATEVEPTDAKGWAVLAMAYFQKRDWEPTIANATRAIELDEKQFLAWLARAQARIERGELELAKADAERCVELSGPREDRGLLVRARVRTSISDFDGAIADATKVVAMSPGRSDAWGYRSEAYLFKGDYDAALEDIEKAVELDPENPSHWDDRATILSHKGQHERAIKDDTKAIKLAPKNATFWHNRGNSKLQVKDWDGAIADATKALELDPRFVAAFSTRGNALAGKGELEKALADATRAIELDPHRVNYRHDRAQLREMLGDHAGAIADWTAAIENDPDRPENLRCRGLARVAAGDRQGARADLERFLELAPRSPHAAKVREALDGLR